MVKKRAAKKKVTKEQQPEEGQQQPEEIKEPAVETEKTTKTEAKEEVPDDFVGQKSLGTVRATNVGRNKCGMPWKKSSKRSEFSRGPPVSYLKSMEEKARIKRI